MGKLKSQTEINEEIEAAKRTITNYQSAFLDDEISLEQLDYQLLDNNSTIEILNWSFNKSHDDINVKISELDNLLESHRSEYINKKIERAAFRIHSNKLGSQIAALKWVLGENDRYD